MIECPTVEIKGECWKINSNCRHRGRSMDSDGREVFSRIPPSTQLARNNETAQQNHLYFGPPFGVKWFPDSRVRSNKFQPRILSLFPSVQVYRSLKFGNKEPPEILVHRQICSIVFRRRLFQHALEGALKTLRGVNSILG